MDDVAQRMRERPLRVVHTSDVHLSSSPSETEEAAAARAALRGVVELARAESADLLLVAGDLFDSNSVSDDLVDFARGQFREVEAPVVLIPGNHDCFDESSVYRRFDWRLAGLHLLSAAEGEVVRFEHLDLSVWGKGMVDHAPENRPLSGVARRDGERWAIGMAHGLVMEGPPELRSSLIPAADIAASELDYLALGHVHVFRDVSHGVTRAFYPGAPVVPWAPEKASVAVVTLDPRSGVRVESRHPLAAVRGCRG